MSDTKYQGKTYSFWQLLQEQKIEIPIIQRDYAQGREDKNEIRTVFLTALYNSIVRESSIELDFIYGSKLNDIFQPLDGQQRLTTLFLLYWYTALKEFKLTNDIKEVLIKFSYETRTSSREFCNQLVNNVININAHVGKISDLIVDSSWFFLAWKKDPTIDGMLRAIDDIHQRFYSVDNIWDKLTSDKVTISFYYVELENFGLTDDLYIKMNSRGKLLTAFENFKATFQKQIDDKKWDSGKEFPDSFACKVDAQWTDLFWSHRKENKIDEAFIRFISTIAMIRIVLEKSEDRIRKLSELQRQPDIVKIDYFSEDGYKYLYESLETYCQLYNSEISVELDFPLWQHKPDQSLFAALVYEESSFSNNATYTQKALFYAQTEYLRRVTVSKFDEEKFRCWMRVIRNVVSRGDAEKTGKRPSIVRSPETFDGVINLISELSEGCNDIYEFLASHTIKSSFAKSQMDEEKLKADLIIENDNYKRVIFSTEDTNFCQGRIDFTLYCIDYDKTQNNFDNVKLEKIQKVIEKYLDKEVTNDLRRGLLTISDDKGLYNYYNYWWSFSFAVSANKRCLIDKYYELEYYAYSGYKEYLKNLLLQLTAKELKDIISDFIPPEDMPNWKVRLIKEPNLLDERCKSNYIAIPEDESCCFLLKGMRPRDIDDCEKIE